MSVSGAHARAEHLRRQAAAMMQSAMRKLAEASQLEEGEATGETRYEIVDFDSLPGRSPRARAEALLMGRRIRDRLFPAGIFGEPAWDLLLELFLAAQDPRGLPVASVVKMARVPEGTALRWVDLLITRGLLERGGAGEDSADETVRLSGAGIDLMGGFFALTEGQSPVPNAAARYPRMARSSPYEA